jgi:murein DD-endopeptidase MepM/ murein hydrolase activator NlpD
VLVESNVQIAAGQFDLQYLDLTPEQCAETFDPEVTFERAFSDYHDDHRLYAKARVDRSVSPADWRRRHVGVRHAALLQLFPRRLMYHEGLDLRGLGGTPVYAPAPGTVVLAEPLIVRGNAIVVDHGWGVFSGYWHCRKST